MNRTALPVLAICLSSLAPFAHAGDLRVMMQQPGEWEMTMHGAMMPPMKQKGCYGGDKSVADLTTKNMKNCSQKSVNITGAMATVDAVCELEGIDVTIHGVVTPVGNDALHSESQIRMQGMPTIPGIPTAMNMSIDAHRTGPCRPGEKRM